MGRLRHDEDFTYIQCVTDEVVDLFGTLATLYRFSSADNVTNRDPLYDEPEDNHTVRRAKYNIKVMFFNLRESAMPSNEGTAFQTDTEIYISLAHLVHAGVAADQFGDYIAEADIIEVHPGERNAIYYDVITANKVGWVNDSHQFTGYDLTVKRNTTFVPERQEDTE